MRTNIITLGIFLLLSFCTQATGQVWEQLYPNITTDQPSSSAKRTVAAADGGFHVLISSSNGTQNYLMKVDADGETQTTTPIGSPTNDVAIDLLETANGELVVLLLAGNTQVDANVKFLRFDTNYNLLHESLIGTIDKIEQPRDFFELPNGEFWITGLGATFPARSFLVKVSAEGALLTPFIYTGFNYFLTKNTFPTNTGGAKVIGYARINNTGDYKILLNEYNSNGDYLSQIVYENPTGQLLPNHTIQTSDGGLLIAASMNNGNTTPLLIKTDATGVETWRNEYTGLPGFLYLSSVAENITTSGYRLLYREQNPTPVQHLGVINTDAQGNWIWKKEYAPLYFSAGESILNLPDGGSLVSGHRSRRAKDFYDYDVVPYLVRTDDFGKSLSSGLFGTVGQDYDEDCVSDDVALAAGKLVTVYENDFAVASTEVDAMGDFFLPLQGGSYKLAVDLPNFLWSSCQDSIDLTIAVFDTLIGPDFVIAYNNEPLDSIYGHVFEDYDLDCVRDSFETQGYEGWIVRLDMNEDGNGVTFLDTTDINGFFSFNNLLGLTNGATGLISFQAPIGTGLNCGIPCWQEYEFGPVMGNSYEINNGVRCDTLPFCPIMSTSIATDELRPCQDEVYKVYYCNVGGVTAANAYLEVTLDSALIFNGSSLPVASQNGNVYTFELGDLLSNECGTFDIDVFVSCDDPVGMTYCSEVYAYPDSTCAGPSPDWDMSEIELSVVCEEDSLTFHIQNIGTGNMVAPLEYIVIEDNVLLYSVPQTFQLEAGQTMSVKYPANGSFYRMRAEQPTGFPGLNTPISWIEGCGTGTPSFGLVNQYPLGDEDLWQDIFCIESVNSYDPNDKNGFPRGVGEEFYIEQNEALEYMIRFQNTGTADALYVEIRDTIVVEHLNLLTFRPGASSHAYTWDIEGNNVVVFKFENINLPAEMEDEEGSKGFVMIKMEQQQDLPIGTKINNQAAIYFDNNAPIITNQTLHTIGEDYLLYTWTKDLPEEQLKTVKVFPNPTQQQIVIDIQDLSVQHNLRIELYDILGKTVLQTTFELRQAISLESLTSGTYYFKIYQDRKLVGVGKVIKL
ncbi:MAG: T9SS type A sorting domain-containing protein [Saprospiraceae bacterium]